MISHFESTAYLKSQARRLIETSLYWGYYWGEKAGFILKHMGGDREPVVSMSFSTTPVCRSLKGSHA